VECWSDGWCFFGGCADEVEDEHSSAFLVRIGIHCGDSYLFFISSYKNRYTDKQGSEIIRMAG
jgi:hypothetical protein